MDIETVSKIADVDRTVDTIDRDGQPAKLLVAARSYPTSIEDLWDVLTDQERIARWFAPVSGELRLGGRYQVEHNAEGEVLACEPPTHLDLTWEFGGMVSWVTVNLSGEPGGEEARLELRHVAHVPDELWKEFGPGATGLGWDLALLGLDLHLTAGAEASSDEVAAWDASDDARAFKEAASGAWAHASIAAGTDRAEAEAAAERTTAFYTATE